MKILTFTLTIFIISLFSFATCEDKCFARVCVEAINFKLIDKLTQQDLVLGANPRFSPDSMQLNKSPDFSLGYHPNYLSTVNQTGNNLIASTGISARDTAFLRLAHNDIDTLIITYAYDQKECCDNFGGYGKIVSIKYNNLLAAKDVDIYKFEKQ